MSLRFTKNPEEYTSISSGLSIDSYDPSIEFPDTDGSQRENVDAFVHDVADQDEILLGSEQRAKSRSLHVQRPE